MRVPMRKCRTSRERGFTLIELMIVIAIILVILAIALPQLGKTQMQSKEMAAVATLRTINTEEVQYESQFGQYATSLGELGPPAAGASEGPQAAGLIPPNLATGVSSGYQFAIAKTPNGYAATAVPTQYKTTGRRTFYTDQTNVIRQNWGREQATASSPEIK